MTVNELMEMIFDLAYLAAIYILVAMMIIKLFKKSVERKKTAGLFIAAFLLLAVGDTGHVGFRVIAYLSGGLEANRMLTGAGSLSTALTVTVFYMLMMEILIDYSERKRTPIYWFVMLAGVSRLIFLLLPGNNWGGPTPLVWSYARNAILTAMGIIIAALYLKEGSAGGDILLKRIAVCILISFGFYLPVILFVHLVPALGILMIPKTCAYIAVAVIGYNNLFKTGVRI